MVVESPMEVLKEAASIAIIVAVVIGLNWLLRKAGFRGS
jgi:hypothetical protein